MSEPLNDDAFDAYSAVVTRVAAELTPRVAALRVDPQGRGGTGSGVVFTEDGYVLTNAHVVGRSRGGTAAFDDGTSAPFRLVGRDVQGRRAHQDRGRARSVRRQLVLRAHGRLRRRHDGPARILHRADDGGGFKLRPRRYGGQDGHKQDCEDAFHCLFPQAPSVTGDASPARYANTTDAQQRKGRLTQN